MGIKLDRDYYDDKALTLDEPLRNSRIGYQNFVTELNVVADAVAGFPARALGNPFTYELWKPPTNPATVTVDMGASRSVDYIGIAAHALAGCSVTVLTSPDGSTYTEQRQAVILKNRPVMLLFEPVTARYVQLKVEGWGEEPTLLLDFAGQQYGAGDATDIGGAYAGVLYVGASLQMQRSQYGGVTPQPFTKSTEIRPSVSEGGQWLGRSVVRKGFTADTAWKHLKADWVRDKFLPFIDHAVEGEGAFFIAWRPDGFADEVFYAWTDSDIRPSNMGVADFMEVSFSFSGHSNE